MDAVIFTQFFFEKTERNTGHHTSALEITILPRGAFHRSCRVLAIPRATTQDPKDKLELKENVDSGVYVKDLTTFVVKSAMEIDHVMQASSPPPRATSERREAALGHPCRPVKMRDRL